MDKKNNILAFTILFVIVLFHVINNSIILTKYPHAYAWVTVGTDIQEQIEKSEISSELDGIIKNRDGNKPILMGLADLLKTQSHRPKLVPLIYAIGDLLLKDGLSFILINSLYYLILVFGTYLLARQVYGAGVGLFSSFLVSLYPAIFTYSRTIYLDFPLTALSVFALYFIIKAENFNRRAYSIMFGVFLGLGILTKGSVFVFLLAPFLQCLVNIFRNRKNSASLRRKSLFNLIAAIFIGALISSLWWKDSLSLIVSKFLLYLDPHRVKQIVDDIHFLPKQSTGFLYAVRESIVFLGQQLFYCSGFLFYVFIAGLILLLKRKQFRENNFLFYLFMPLAVLIFSSLKAPRYLMPALSVMAIITSAGLLGIKSRIARISIFLFVFVAALAQFFTASYVGPYKFIKFYNTIYGQYDAAALKFMNSTKLMDINSPHLAFISESSWKTPDSLRTLYYFLRKNQSSNESLLYATDIMDIAGCDFVILSLDRRYYLKLASFLEEGRKSAAKNAYMDQFIKYHPWDRRHIAMALLDQNKFNLYINGMGKILSRRKNREEPLEIYEKLLVLEAIKRKVLDTEEAKRLCEAIFEDVLFWSKIYNINGIAGLSQNLTLSQKELTSFLEEGLAMRYLLSDEKWKWVNENLNRHKFVMLESADIPSLGITFCLFAKKRTLIPKLNFRLNNQP